MSSDIKAETPRINWDNDMVPVLLGSRSGTTIKGNVRKIAWTDTSFDPLNHEEGVTEEMMPPINTYTTKSNISKMYESGVLQANEGGINSVVHAFTFYMGEALTFEEKNNVRYVDPFSKSQLVDTRAKEAILSAISEKLEKLRGPVSEEYPVDIQLSWKNSSTHLELVSELGEKDKQESCGEKRYFVKSEDELTPGTYAVSITNSEAVDNNSLPENITLDIHVLDKRMTLELDVLSADMLNIGHAADIIIDVNADGDINASVSNQDLNRTGLQGIKVKHYYKVSNSQGIPSDEITNAAGIEAGDALCWVSDQLSYSEAVTVCEDRGTNGEVITIEDDEGNTESAKGYVYDIKSRLNQAELGPLGGAEISLSLVGSGAEVYQGTTTDGSSLISTGIILFPQEIIQNLDNKNLYLVEVNGGTDIDANDDGILDSIATVNSGKVHAIVSGKQIKDGNFKVNILTEIVFQATKKMLNDELNVTSVIGHMDVVSDMLLSADMDSQERSDYNNTLHWLPMFDKKQLKFNYSEEIEPIVQKIYRGENIYLDVYKLLYAGKVDALQVDNNSTVNGLSLDLNSYADLSQLKKEDFVLKDSSGNSVDFRFEIVDGKVVIYPLSDLVEGKSYTLSFELKIYDSQDNVYVDTQLHTFTIPDITPPVIPESTIHVNENMTYAVSFATDPSTPLTYTIIGGSDSTLFELRNTFTGYNTYADMIYFKKAPNYERPSDSNGDNVYELKVGVADRFNNVTTENIQIIVDDVKEGPLLADTNMMINENMPIGTYVGTMTVVNEGDGNLTEFSIYRYSDNFRIDKEGRIYTITVLDYERIHEYNLSVHARNSVSASSAYVNARIVIGDIFEPLPEVHSFTGSMDDHAPKGKVVGQLYVYPGLDTKVEVRLVGEGSDDFDVNSSGHITVSATADLNHEVQKQYDLKAIASNTYGESEESNVTIYINVWTKQIGTTLRDYSGAIAVDGENNSYLSGEIDISYPQNGRVFINKYNSIGELQWSYETNQSEKIKVSSITVDKNGIVFVTGAKANGRTYVRYDNIYDGYSSWIMALTSQGEELWTKVLDNGASGADSLSASFVAEDGYVIVSGNTTGVFEGYEHNAGNSLFFAKFSVLGEIEWIKQFQLYGANLKVNNKGEFYFQSGKELMIFDSSAENIIWNKEITVPNTSNTYYDIEDYTFDSDANILLLCREYNWIEGEEDGEYFYRDDFNTAIAKLNNDGVLLWKKTYGSNRYEFPYAITTNKNNEIYFIGDTRGSLYNNINKVPYLDSQDVGDVFLTKVDTDGHMMKTKQFGSTGWDGSGKITVDANNDIYMTGGVSESLDGNTHFGGYDIFMMKIPY